jgi:hypothetical protein
MDSQFGAFSEGFLREQTNLFQLFFFFFFFLLSMAIDRNIFTTISNNTWAVSTPISLNTSDRVFL